MAFDKDKYWEQKKDNVGSKRPKPKVTPTGDAETSFDNEGRMVVKSRAYRRRPIKLPGDNLFTKKTITKAKRKALRKLGRR